MFAREHFDMAVREAKNEDGAVIGELFERQGLTNGLAIDWFDIEPYWGVVEQGGRVVGAIQFCPGKPVSRLEMLIIDKDMRKRYQAAAVDLLIAYGVMMARLCGSQLLSGLIPDHLPGYARVAEKRGFWPGDHGRLYFCGVRSQT